MRTADERLRNWAGNLEYSTTNLFSARSFDEVAAAVAVRERLKVLGSRHCFNAIADSRDQFLSLASLDQILSLDGDARTVTVGAGIRYGQLCPPLDAKGFALHNLASLPHISIAGACSTATHDRYAIVYAMVPLAAAAALQGDDLWAARILGARDAVTERTGATIVDRWVHGLGEQAERDVRARLGPDRWARAYAAGRVTSIDSLIEDIDSVLKIRARP